jgi:hypothetical protein
MSSFHPYSSCPIQAYLTTQCFPRLLILQSMFIVLCFLVFFSLADFLYILFVFCNLLVRSLFYFLIFHLFKKLTCAIPVLSLNFYFSINKPVHLNFQNKILFIDQITC